MALILDSTIINTAVSKLVETPTGFLFNAQYYDKETFSPVPFNQIAINNGVPGLLFTNKKTIVNSNGTNLSTWNEKAIINDEYIENKFYIFGSSKIYVFDRNEYGGINLINSCDFSGIYDKYLGQNQNFIYFFTNEANRYQWLYIYNKSNNTTSNPVVYDGNAYGVSSMKILETNEYIYYANKYSLFSLSIARVSKSTNIVELIKNNISLGNLISGIWRTNDVFIEDNIVSFYIPNFSDLTKPFKLLKLNLDEKVITNMVSIEDVNFTWNLNIDKISLLSQKAASIYESFVIKKNNKIFINLIMYQTDTTIRQTTQGLYTFELIDFNTLKFINYSSISSSSMKGFLITENRNHLLIITTDSIVFMNFDINIGCYEISDVIPKNFLSIGLDISERVWIMNSDYTVEMVTLNEVTNFSMKFEKDFYKYIGENIDTNVTIEAKNYNGEYINALLNLTIVGNAKFKSNNNKVINVNTNNSPLTIPITLTGADMVSIYPKFISNI